MRSYKIEGVVIKRRNFGEKDRVLTIFSRERGKTEVLSKGCRRPGSRLAHCSDLGVVGIFFVHEGRNLDILSEFRAKFFPQSISGDYEMTRFVSRIFAILDKLYEASHPHQPTYETIVELLQEANARPIKILQIYFLSKIIADLGLQPDLQKCAVCQLEFLSDDEIVYDQQGELCHKKCCDAGEEISKDAVKYLRLVFSKKIDFILKVRADKKAVEQSNGYLTKNMAWHFGANKINKVLFELANDE
jgi:DNA repair protein RecO (recombination protein O)